MQEKIRGREKEKKLTQVLILVKKHNHPFSKDNIVINKNQYTMFSLTWIYFYFNCILKILERKTFSS